MQREKNTCKDTQFSERKIPALPHCIICTRRHKWVQKSPEINVGWQASFWRLQSCWWSNRVVRHNSFGWWNRNYSVWNMEQLTLHKPVSHPRTCWLPCVLVFVVVFVFVFVLTMLICVTVRDMLTGLCICYCVCICICICIDLAQACHTPGHAGCPPVKLKSVNKQEEGKGRCHSWEVPQKRQGYLIHSFHWCQI